MGGSIVSLLFSLLFPPLPKILSTFLGNSVPKCTIFQAVVGIKVPTDLNHEFWSRSGLQSHDGTYDDTIPVTFVEVRTLGRSDIEAKRHAYLELMSFLDECREQLALLTRPGGTMRSSNSLQWNLRS